MTGHVLDLEETRADRIDTAAFKAFCSCGWAGEWHHADEPADQPERAADEAETAAIEEGQEHLADETGNN